MLDAVSGLGSVQIDPTNAVARAEHLVLWSRLGAGYRPDDLARLIAERSLFEYRAFVYPAADFPLHRPRMEAWPHGETAFARRAREWLRVNASFRDHVVAELEANGPLRSRDLDDRAQVSWSSRGWTNDRNVTQMLEFLAARGEVAVAGREGSQRLWDLGRRILPVDLPRSPAAEAERILAARRLRSAGIVRARGVTGGVPVEIEGVAGRWVADPELLERPFAGRTAILAPFDRLVYDRGRLLALFGVEYRLEIYVPVAKRRWGYYVLPVLHGDRIVAKVDAKADRPAGVLDVRAIHAEQGAGPEDRRAVLAELDALAGWLGLSAVRLHPSAT